jgi:hypothetical protein
MRGAGVVYDNYDWRILMCVNKMFQRWLPMGWEGWLPTYRQALLVLGSERALKDIKDKKSLKRITIAESFIMRPRSTRDLMCWQKVLGCRCFQMENSVDFEYFAMWNLRPETLTAFHHLYDLGVLSHMDRWLSPDRSSDVHGLRALVLRGTPTFIAFIRQHIVPHAPQYALGQDCITIYDTLILMEEKELAKKALTVCHYALHILDARFVKGFSRNTLDPEFVEAFFDAGGSRLIRDGIIGAVSHEDNPINNLVYRLLLKHSPDRIKRSITNNYRWYLHDKVKGLLHNNNREFEMLFSTPALALLAEFKIDIPSLCTEGPRSLDHV